jgi:hypothetical protein
MNRKLPAVLIGFGILGLLDCLMAYAFPISFEVSHMSLTSHFFFLGTLIYTYNKPALTRVLVGLLCGLAQNFLFQGTFPSFLLYGLAAWAAGLSFKAGNHRVFSFFWFAFFCLLYDFVFYALIKAVQPGYYTFFSWFWHFECMGIILNLFSIYGIRYCADVMDRYFALRQARLKRQEQKELNDIKAVRP